MGKKAKLSIVAFVIFVIGGIIMFSLNQKREQTEAQQIRHEQERIVQYIGEHIELMDGKNIDKIEFVEFQKNDMTGFYISNAIVNSKYKVTFYLAGLGGDIDIDFRTDSFIQEHPKIYNSNIDIRGIKIIYFNKGG